MSEPLRASSDTCVCREKHENDEPNFFVDGRTRSQAQKACRTFVLLHPEPYRDWSTDEIVEMLNVFGYFFPEYDINDSAAVQMIHRVLADRTILEAGEARARIAETVDNMVSAALRREISDALAIMENETLNANSNQDQALSAMKAGHPDGLVDGKPQTCVLCAVKSMNTAGHRAHCCSKGHYDELTKQTVRCATCNWGAIGRGVHEHMAGKKHRKKMMAYFAERGWISARGAGMKPDASSSSTS